MARIAADTLNNRTQSAITFTIDYNGGVDPVAGTLVDDQASADAVGTFASIPGAVDTLPDNIRHLIRFELVDGVHTLVNNAIPLGDYGRFSLGITAGGIPGEFFLASQNGLVLAPSGALGLAVPSGDATVLELAVDPGLAVDLFQRFFVRVASGTGAGQIKAVRDHSGRFWNISGRFSPAPDATSTVEVVEGAARLVENGSGDTTLRNTVPSDLGTFSPAFRLEAIDFSTTAAGALFRCLGMGFQGRGGARLIGMRMSTVNAVVSLQDFILDGAGVVTSGNLLTSAKGRTRSRNSGNSWILGDNPTGTGLSLNGNGGGAVQGFLFQGAIDDVDRGVDVVGVQALLRVSSSNLRGNPTTTGIELREGARVNIPVGEALNPSNLVAGATDEFLLDGVSTAATTLDADPNDVLTGVRNSFLDGN